MEYPIQKRLRALTFAGLAVFAAACGNDSTGPASNDPFDVEQSNQDFAGVQAALAANADLASDISYVSNVLEGLGPVARRFERVEVPGEASVLRMARTVRLSANGGSSASQPLLPSDVLGKTYEWDEVEGDYLQTARTGAPGNGVRFIVYDRTANPFLEVGYLDVTDESDPSADRLRVLLVKDGVTRLDYDVVITETTSSATVSVAGFVTDGVQRVDFDVTETAEETASGFTVELDYELSLAGQPLSVRLQYQIDFGETVSARITATFVNGLNTLVLDMAQDGQGAIDGEVTWNGAVVMIVTGSGESEPIFLGPEGEDLTLAEAQAITEMFELASEGLFFLLANLAFLGAGLA